MTTRYTVFLLTMASAFLSTSRPTVARAGTCNAFLEINYRNGPNFALPGDVYRVSLAIGAGEIEGGTELSINRVRFALDCDSTFPLDIPCEDDGPLIQYEGDSTITTDCRGPGGLLGFTTGHPVSADVNELVFTPRGPGGDPSPIIIPTANFCTVEFDVKISSVTGSDVTTPTRIEQVAGWNTTGDAVCDNGLESCASQSIAIAVCPSCAGDECNTAACNQQSGACDLTPMAPGTPCTDTDGDVCTTAGCDGQGTCSQTQNRNPQCDDNCGENASGPCVVTVDTPPATFDGLQEAINAADDGATIHVTGVCVESVLIDQRNDLTIEGDAPTVTGCPSDGLDPADLTSTVKGDSQDVPDVIKVRNSTNIVIRFLNVVDGGPKKTGVEFRTGMSNSALCNCITRNKDGIEFDRHGQGTASKNLIFENNRDGLWLHRCVTDAQLFMNTLRENLDDGIEIDDSCTDHNLVIMNLVTKNVHDGIEVIDSDNNTIVANEVTFNGHSKSRDSGIELKPGTGPHGSDKNFVDRNDIHDNSDLLVNLLNCKETNGRHNTGDNVPPNCQ